ncbi:EH domain-containing protein 4 isoform X2 [Anguilla anguilla]|uniref:EH domain-containing protein 4 isoform X2 n=1 Tax=Anguilla anguilla TaxID=7936 RepID=UPI0015AAD001|nr:EH domain-containing protein 4 isoform X2 [Anguilla anguilla]
MLRFWGTGRTVVRPCDTGCAVLRPCDTGCAVLRPCDTGRTVLRPCDTGCAVLWPCDTGCAVLRPCDTGRTVLRPCDTGCAVLRPCDTGCAVLRPCDTGRTVVRPCDTGCAVLRPCDTGCAVLRPCDTGRTVLRPCDTGCAVLWPCDTGCAVLRPCDTGRTVLRPCDTGCAVLRPCDTGCAVLRPCDTGCAVLRPCDTGRAVLRPCDTDRTVLRPCDTGRTVLRPCDTGRTVLRPCDTGCAVLRLCVLSCHGSGLSPGYDFSEVLRWFGERVDRIILLFDAHKLDISDEFSEAIRAFRGQDDKIRVVLNKADQVDTQQLMRVYGALMWSLGKVINTPEVVRVYLGSFWAKPLQNTENRRLFEAETQDLFKDIQGLPRNAALRKLNDLIKRARLAKVHAYIISYLKKEMPSLFGKEKKKEELISRLPEIYCILQREHHISAGDFPNVTKMQVLTLHLYARTHVHILQREHHISAGDFPNVTKMQEQLQNYDFSKFPSLKTKLIESVDKMLANKIAGLMSMIREEESRQPPQQVSGGAFEGSQDGPFGHGYEEGVRAGADAEDWIVCRDKPKYDEIFYTLMPVNGRVSGANAKKEMMNSRLPNTVLGKIWKLADCDHDGMLDDEEFALAQHLIKIKLEGFELPSELPPHLVPPSHRKDPTADTLYNHQED